MLAFPTLKTGVMLQYPAQRTMLFSNQVLTFLDGSEQRFRLTKPGLHRWTIQLDLLDDTELKALETFLSDTQGSFADFAFTDPIDGTAYPLCYLENDGLEGIREGGLRGRTTLTICEERSS